MLVTAIMPTTKRRDAMRPMAIDCFQPQTRKEKELLILDLDDYTIGAKRNALCEHANGDIIVHWDDDDWSHPNRIADQVSHLESSGKDVVGYRELLFWNENLNNARRYIGEEGYAPGSSLCYRKSFWEANQFPDEMRGEDNHFTSVARKQGVMISVPANGMMVCRIHNDNTCALNYSLPSAWPLVPLGDVPDLFLQC